MRNFYSLEEPDVLVHYMNDSYKEFGIAMECGNGHLVAYIGKRETTYSIHESHSRAQAEYLISIR